MVFLKKKIFYNIVVYFRKFTCSSRFLFKYNYPTKIEDRLNVACLVCHNQYNTTEIEFMKCHRRSCKSDQLVPDPVKENGKIPQTAQPINAMSSGIVCSKSDLNGPATETPPQTQKESEVLVSVQTISETVDQSDDVGNVADEVENSPLTNQSNQNVCFICNSTENKLFKSMYTTVSGASKTVIFELVWKFLGGRPSVRNETTDASCMNEVVCGECLDLVNEYDAARADAIDLRKGLINKITETEKQIVKRQNDNAKKNGIGEKSLENFQERSSLTRDGATFTSKNDQGTFIDLCDDDE